MATGKVIEGEAVLINVVTGRYYSLCDASCLAWVVLSDGGSIDDTVAAITDRYTVNGASVRDDVLALVEELLAEELLVPAEGTPAAEPALPPADEPPSPYKKVRLETFRDMEELLAFDPPLPQVPGQLSQIRH